MSDKSTPETDAKEAQFRATWLHQHAAPAQWLIMTADEMAVLKENKEQLERQRDEVRAEATAGALDHMDTIKERDTLRAELATLRVQSQDRGAAIEAAAKALLLDLYHDGQLRIVDQGDRIRIERNITKHLRALVATITNSQNIESHPVYDPAEWLRNIPTQEAIQIPEKDIARLNFLDSNALDVILHSDTTKQGSPIVNWAVVSHHSTKPYRREIGHGETARDAIDDAITNSQQKGGARRICGGCGFPLDDSRICHTWQCGNDYSKHPEFDGLELAPTEVKGGDAPCEKSTDHLTHQALASNAAPTSNPEGAAILTTAIAELSDAWEEPLQRTAQKIATPPSVTHEAMTLAQKIALALYPKREDERQYPMFLAYRERAERTVESVLSRWTRKANGDFSEPRKEELCVSESKSDANATESKTATDSAQNAESVSEVAKQIMDFAWGPDSDIRVQCEIESILTRLRAQDAEELRRRDAALKVARDALKAECAQFRFPDEDRPICHAALAAIDKELKNP